MSLFSRIFGSHKTAIECDLHDMYTRMLCTRIGWPREEAIKAVSDAITLCKEQGKSEGTHDLPEDFGDRIIEAARQGEPISNRIVEKARREGAVDDDDREWWNLPDLARRMVIWSENMFRYTLFLQKTKDEGFSAEEAAAQVHKMFPIYGDPDDTSKLTGENRPLPHELRGRVDQFRNRHGAKYAAEETSEFSSYNSFVRHAIRAGRI